MYCFTSQLKWFLSYGNVMNTSQQCRLIAAKFKPLLSSWGLWASGRDLYRVIPAVTRCLGLCGVFRRVVTFSCNVWVQVSIEKNVQNFNLFWKPHNIYNFCLFISSIGKVFLMKMFLNFVFWLPNFTNLYCLMQSIVYIKFLIFKKILYSIYQRLNQLTP